jgi:hypothetical protein
MKGREIDLKKLLCLNFCAYYKPAKSDELACLGYLVVEHLLKKGKKIIFEKSDKILNSETKEKLTGNICILCPFYEKDCDFILHRGDSPPCGGFTLLGQLLESEVITIDDIIRNIN